ncbi:MAG TPA: hypothetical protein VNB06_21885 [Thermoanaerobaculia bacterium]|nr:hypothetical protein [Thermoanaerobaculia bacterium]
MGLRLRQYLPVWTGALLAALALALAAPRVRLAVAEALWRLDGKIDSVRWSLPRLLVVWVGLGLALWLVRDRQLLGDAC